MNEKTLRDLHLKVIKVRSLILELRVIKNVRRQKIMKNTIKKLIKDNRGIGIVEIILILVIIIALVVIFKDQITAIIQDAFSSISDSQSSLSSEITIN